MLMGVAPGTPPSYAIPPHILYTDTKLSQNNYIHTYATCGRPGLANGVAARLYSLCVAYALSASEQGSLQYTPITSHNISQCPDRGKIAAWGVYFSWCLHLRKRSFAKWLLYELNEMFILLSRGLLRTSLTVTRFYEVKEYQAEMGYISCLGVYHYFVKHIFYEVTPPCIGLSIIVVYSTTYFY